MGMPNTHVTPPAPGSALEGRPPAAGLRPSREPIQPFMWGWPRARRARRTAARRSWRWRGAGHAHAIGVAVNFGCERWIAAFRRITTSRHGDWTRRQRPRGRCKEGSDEYRVDTPDPALARVRGAGRLVLHDDRGSDDRQRRAADDRPASPLL